MPYAGYQPLGAANSYVLSTVTGAPSISRHSDSDGRIDGYTLADTGVTLGHDRLGNVTALDNGNTAAIDQTYQYDGLNRLAGFTSNTDSSLNQSYGYDAASNRTDKTVAGAGTGYLLENTSNRLLSVGGTAYGYDTAGNLSKPRP